MKHLTEPFKVLYKTSYTTFCWLLGFCICCILLDSSAHREISLAQNPTLHTCILDIIFDFTGNDFIISHSIFSFIVDKTYI